MRSIDKFLASVHAKPSTANIFNPWRDHDPLNDLDRRAPEHRLDHLTHYMEERLHSARVVLVAEAPGYQGCKFSGLAMTSERALLESNDMLDNEGSIYFSGGKYRTSNIRLSSGKTNLFGSIEPTATIVWNTMMQRFGSHQFVLWNSFAFHPHEVGDMLSNRPPMEKELESEKETLQLFLTTFPGRQVVAVGRKAEGALTKLGVPYKAVRHPANGGATKFREGIAGLAQLTT